MSKKYLYLLLSIIINTSFMFGQWSTTKEQNLQVCDWGLAPFSATSDGKGGIYISVSKDYYLIGDTIFHIESYLFKVDRYGYICWPEPKQIKALGNWQDHVNLIPDNENGVLVGYVDKKHLYYWQQVEPIYDWKYRIQKIDPDGNLLWGDGVLAVNDTCDHIYGSLISDGNGGCFVAVISDTLYWLDNDYTISVVIQHISSTGERLWGEKGIKMWKGNLGDFVKPPFEIYLGLNNDVFFQNNVEPKDISVHRYDYDGNELLVIPSRINWYETCLLPTKEDGLILIGFHKENDVWKLAMDRIDYDGNILWDSVRVLADSVDGEYWGLTDAFIYDDQILFLNWYDADYLYLQKISYDGQFLFEGRGLIPHSYSSWGTDIYRCDDDIVLVDGIMAQKYNLNGEKLWGDEGLWFASYGAAREKIQSDMNGGFIMAWQENGEGTWVKQVGRNGIIGKVTSYIDQSDTNLLYRYHLYQNYPNPFNNSTRISFTINSPVNTKLQIIDILGNVIWTDKQYYDTPGTYSISLRSSNISSGIYFYRIVLFDNKGRVVQISDSKKMILIK